MNKSFFIIPFILVLFCCSPKPTSLIYRQDVFQNKLGLISEEDSLMLKAIEILRVKGDEVINKDINSVTFKEKVPPGGTKNDYWSIAPYWWPDPAKPDGLPYINRDGRVNPESKSIRDKEFLYEVFNDMELLGLSYVYFKDEKYVDHAVKLVKAWFIDSETKMNPNLNFGQSIPGVNNGRITGIIDTRGLMNLLESVLQLRNSPNWDMQTDQGLNNWVNSYLNWMLYSDLGKQGKNLNNNIGTAYDNQVIYYMLFLGKKLNAKQYISNTLPGRLDVQFEADGSQPHELKRTKSWDYSRANLEEWMRLVRLAENVDFDLFNYETKSGRSVRKAYEWLKPYGTGDKKWEFEQITNTNIQRSFDRIDTQVRSSRYGRNVDSSRSGNRSRATTAVVNESNFKFFLIN
jgi:hypothetical protein